jgi:DNA processing protein
VRSADDVIEDLQGLSGNRKEEKGDGKQGTGDRKQAAGDRTAEHEEHPTPESAVPRVPELSPTEQRVFDALATRRHADELARELGLAVGELSRTLMLLELKKLVRRLPGNFYERR